MIDEDKYRFYRKFFPILGQLGLVRCRTIEVNIGDAENRYQWYRKVLFTYPDGWPLYREYRV